MDCSMLQEGLEAVSPKWWWIVMRRSCQGKSEGADEASTAVS